MDPQIEGSHPYPHIHIHIHIHKKHTRTHRHPLIEIHTEHTDKDTNRQQAKTQTNTNTQILSFVVAKALSFIFSGVAHSTTYLPLWEYIFSFFPIHFSPKVSFSFSDFCCRVASWKKNLSTFAARAVLFTFRIHSWAQKCTLHKFPPPCSSRR